ncbi:MAG TPA: DNA polymerase II, partial [Thermoproteales archaeon]|nr:DNA polymerase II [Thermoproteales archaeon]
AEIAKEVQEKITEILLKKASVDEAIKYVRDVISELRAGKVPIEKLVIWKTLSKKIEEYEVDIAHVRVAKMLMRAGYKISKGEKIGYIICKEGEKLAEKAKPYIFVKDYSDVDVDYYIQKQILPVALRVLKYFGVTEQQILKGEKQASILEFFGA